jgi:hypothetical protein
MPPQPVSQKLPLWLAIPFLVVSIALIITLVIGAIRGFGRVGDVIVTTCLIADFALVNAIIGWSKPTRPRTKAGR